MTQRLPRRMSALMLVLFLLSLAPSQTSTAAPALEDAAARFAQLRAHVPGRRSLPSAPAGVTSPPPAAPPVDQAARREQLERRWAREQTRDLPRPTPPAPAPLAHGYLPLLVRQPGPVASPAPSAAPPLELTAYRDAHSRTYAYPDGHWETQIYGQPINYQRPDGAWQPYAPALQPVSIAQASAGASPSDGYQSSGTDLDLRFAAPQPGLRLASATPLVQLRDGSLALGFTPQHAALGRPVVAGATITYRDAFPAADLRYTVTGPGVKEELIFARPPAADFALSFDMRVAGGSLSQHGQTILVSDAQGRPRWRIDAPFLIDARGATSSAVRVALETGGGMTTLRYTPDAAWLADPARAYPVTLDPTIGPLGAAGDTYVAENPPADLEHHTENALFVGYATAGIAPIKGRSRFFINFALPDLPAGVAAADIDSATLSLYQYMDERGGSYQVEIYPTDDPWVESGKRWSTQPGRGPRFAIQTVSAGIGRKSFDLTTLVQSWYVGGTPADPRGVAFLAVNEYQPAGRFGSRDCVPYPYYCNAEGATGDAKPYLSLAYTPVPAGTDEIRLTESLSFTPDDPSNPPLKGTTVTARFALKNVSGRTIPIPALQVKMRRSATASYDFPQVTNVVLAPGQEYTYAQSRALPESGLYAGDAQFSDGASWYRVYIAPGSGLVNARHYLMADPLPAPEKRTQGPSGPNGSSGDPVNTSTGNFAASAVDATLPDVGPALVFGRTFNSRDTERAGPFGPGWSATYAEQLIRRDDESVVYLRGDGQVVYFGANFDARYVASGNDGEAQYVPNGSYRTEDGFDLTLSRAADGTWALVDRDLASRSFDGDGRLQRIADRYSSAIALGYTGDTLASVASATTTCTLGWSNDRVTAITCPTGTLRYSYDSAGDLVGATNLAGETTRYTYDSAHRVTAITDANGRLVVENVYDAQGRVLQQREGITPWTSFSYDTLTRSTTYTDAGGHQLTDTYDQRDRLVRRVDALGNADSYSYDADDHLLTHTNALGATWRYAYDAAGNLLAETDPLGATWRYTYNSRNQRITETDPLGQTTTLTYTGDLLQATRNPLGGTRSFDATPAGLPLRETDELGHITTRTYTPAGQILSETDPLGATTRYEYNAAGDQTAIVDALGQRAQYAYDAQHRLVRILDPAGAELRFSYDALGNLISETNQLGASRTLFYDGNNRLIGETDFTGAVTEYVYDDVGNLVRTVDPLGQTTRYEYDAASRLTARIDPLGSRWSYSYDRVGRLLAETDSLGRVTRHEYDALGRQTRTVDARGSAVSRSYDLLGRALRETDRLGAVTTSTYDALGRLVSRADALGATTRYAYDAASRLVRTVDPLGQATTLAYDAAGQPVTMTDRVGAVTRFGYDPLGRRLTVTDPRGATTTTSYDPLDRPVRVVDALSQATTTAYDAAGRRLRETDALGFSRSWTYDAAGRVLRAIDRTGATTTTTYDAAGRAITISDALGGIERLAYDAAGRQIAVTDALGRTRRTRYDAVGNPIELTDARGFVTRQEYDANNNLVGTIDALGNVTRQEYDAADHPVRTIDALGQVTSTSYDLLGRPIATRDPNGATTATAYDALGRVVRTTDPRRSSTSTRYDAEGRAIRQIDALGGTTTISYDAAGLPLTETDANGNRSRTEYDLLGRAIRQIDALGHISRTAYDALGNVVTQVDPRGATTTMRYDGERRLLARTDALGQTWRTAYDALGRAIATTDPLGNVEAREYDAVGNLVRTVAPGGQTTRTVYDAANNPIARQDARGFVTLTAYDALGRPTSTTDPLGNVTRTAYDALGRTLIETDANGHAVRMGYDPAGRLVSVTDALSATVRMSYDPAGAVVATLDGNGHRTRTEYDLLGRPTARYDALGNRTRLRYDALGNVVEEQRPSGAAVATRYDALSRPVETRLTPGPVETMSYDEAGNVIARNGGDGQQTISYDLLGRPIRATDGANQTLGWRYDAAGRRTHTIYPDGRAVVTTYDRNGWPVALDDGRGHRTTLSYDADGRLLDTAYPASAARAAYDSRGQLLALLNEGATGPFAVYEYTLDPVGNRTGERISTLSFGGLVTLEQTGYSYDAADRLLRSVRSGPASTALDLRYSYDAAGNRTAISGSAGGTSWTERSSYDAADRLVEQSDSRTGATRYSYDAAGQRLTATGPTGGQRYSYDARGRLLTLTTLDGSGTPTGVVQQYRYDGLGRRTLIEQRAQSGALQASERTLYDGDGWSVLGQIVAGQAPQRFVPQPQGLGQLSVETGGVTRFAHSDGLGSYTAYTDAAGKTGAQLTRYGDWGAIESGVTSLVSGYGYTGHRHDPSGLLYARNRLYDPASATWLTADPFPAQPTQPGALNRYSYVRGNPITRSDPLGLFDWATGTVQPGDTLWGIAQAAGTSVDALLALNPQIANANLIYAGQHLNVGVRSAASHAQQQQQSAQRSGMSGARCGARCNTYYTTVGGDTLSGIGARFGVPWQWIYNQNRSIIGPNPNVIAPGQRLYVPCKNPGGGATTPQPNPGNGGGDGIPGTPGNGNDSYRNMREKLQRIENLPDFGWEFKFNLPVETPDWLRTFLNNLPITFDLKDMGLGFHWDTRREDQGALYCVRIKGGAWFKAPELAFDWKIFSVGGRPGAAMNINLRICENGAADGNAIASRSQGISISVGKDFSVKGVKIGISASFSIDAEGFFDLWSGDIRADIALTVSARVAAIIMYKDWKLAEKQFHPNNRVPDKFALKTYF